MYKGTDIKKHNLEQLRKAQEYFKNNPTKIITIFNDGPKSLAEEIPQQESDEEWAQIEKMANIARQKKQNNQMPADQHRNFHGNKQLSTKYSATTLPIQYKKTMNSSHEPNLITSSSTGLSWNTKYQSLEAYKVQEKKGLEKKKKYSQQAQGYQQQMKSNNIRRGIEEYGMRYNYNNRHKINNNNQIQESSAQNTQYQQQLTSQAQEGRKNQSKKHKKKEKKRPKQKPEVQTKSNQYFLQNIIRQKNPTACTIDSLKRNEPLTRNYKIANKEQWEKTNRIDDYKLKFVLTKFPKIKDYRNNQKAIIKCSLMGNDVFVCMPTGGGKSLTFQAMTFIQKGVYLCILPLVSLIIDQQDQAKKIGIKAFSLTGSKELQQNKMVYQQLRNYQQGQDSIVVFCTPQKVNKSPQFFSTLQEVYHNESLIKIVIDEVHCVSTWGKQFREDYVNLSSLRQNFPKTPILGLTATVTEIIKQDIIKRLGIQNCFYFQSSFNRPNLYYEVREKNKNALNSILQIISSFSNKSGIIYCISRKDCQQLCKVLQQRNIRIEFYHAQISEAQKREIQSKWMDNRIQIIVATIAFGMGINKPDVRFVIHHSLSKSLQNYYQESGRAGRDGEQAKCILFYRKGDKISLQSLITKNEISKDENKNFCMKQLSNMIKYCEDKFTCRRKFQLQYLGQKDFNQTECGRTCDNCQRDLKFVEVECIKQAKILVNFMISLQRAKQSLSQNQIIMIVKGKYEKKFKYKADKIENCFDTFQLKQLFSKWTKIHIDELITELCSAQVFYEKIFTTNTFKNNVVSNFYIKVNYPIANKFLSKVETLPMKRSIDKNWKEPRLDIGEAECQEEEDIEIGEESQSRFQEDRYSFKG